jgi:hypothetical protein
MSAPKGSVGPEGFGSEEQANESAPSYSVLRN